MHFFSFFLIGLFNQCTHTRGIFLSSFDFATSFEVDLGFEFGLIGWFMLNGSILFASFDREGSVVHYTNNCTCPCERLRCAHLTTFACLVRYGGLIRMFVFSPIMCDVWGLGVGVPYDTTLFAFFGCMLRGVPNGL